MLHKVVLKDFPTYAEEGQPNPLRWYILKPTGLNTFENVSAVIKCKDFFNDLAYTLQTGKSFGIYRFNAGTMDLKKDQPVYMLLTETTQNFRHNLGVMNQWLASQNIPPVTEQDSTKGLVVCFDPWYWKNTYRISLISLIVRLMNVDTKFGSFDEVVKHTQFAPKDQAKWTAVVKKNIFFNVSKKFDKYVWYCGPEHNSEKELSYVSSYVHNNGVLSWSNVV